MFPLHQTPRDLYPHLRRQAAPAQSESARTVMELEGKYAALYSNRAQSWTQEDFIADVNFTVLINQFDIDIP